jgi:hypothetical protein
MAAIGMAIAPVVPANVAEQATRADPDEQLWRFRVLLDDREIGFHDFRVRRDGGGSRVEIDARFDVKILFINAYSYRHENTELWQGDCLSRIESSTDDNGELLRVDGAAEGQSFTLSTHEGATTLDSGCVRSFAYWNPSFLEDQRLLNSQTGEFVDVRIEDRGADSVRLGSSEVPARRYTILMEEGTIDLWYAAANGQWLALQSPTEGGRMVRYEPVLLPAEAPDDRRLAME